MNIFHSFLFSEGRHTEQDIFQAIQNFFKSERMAFTESINPFKKSRILKLIVDEKFVTSFRYEVGEAVAIDYQQISKDTRLPSSRIRVLMSPDPNNDFDDIVVMVLQFLSNYPTAQIYDDKGCLLN